MNKLKRFAPILILAIGLMIFFSLGGQKYLSMEMLQQHYQSLLDYTHQHLIVSTVIFMLAYILIVAFSIPGATIMTLLGGFLFGIFPGALWVILSATIGATVVFLAVKSAFGESLQRRAGGNIEKLRQGFSHNAFNYLLTLRLIPIFPFFIINIACGVLGVRLKAFFWGTLLGIIPGSVIYVWVGTGLGFAPQQGEQLNMGIIFQPQFILPIIALALLSLVPMIRKKFTQGQQP